VETLPSVSVIIATRNRPVGLRDCVQSVLACEHSDFEVIVVDQSDTLEPPGRDSRMRHIPQRAIGKSVALNRGIELARGEILAFTDDDCTVPAGWLRDGTALLAAHPEVGLVFGALEAAPHNPGFGLIPTFEPAQFEVIRGAANGSRRGGAGANLFTRKAFLQSIGCFDPRIGPGAKFGACEEYDVYLRALQHGGQVAMDPANAVLHWGFRAFADGSAAELTRRYAYGEGAVLGKHLRQRRPGALRVTGHVFAEYGRDAARSSWAQRGPKRFRPLWEAMRGLAAGCRARGMPDQIPDRSYEAVAER
jgi:GT2 family glycosyltransferase